MLQTSCELNSGFDDWLHGHGVSAHRLWCKVLYPIRSYWHFFPNSRWLPPPSWFSTFENLAHSIMLTVMVLELSTKFGSTICDSHWNNAILFPTFIWWLHSLTGINFRCRLLVMWSSPRGHDASAHQLWCKDLFNSELLTFFWYSIWQLMPSWFINLWEFVDSVVLELCTEFGLNTCYGHWHRRMLQAFIWWRHANKLPFSTFGHVVISAWPWCIFPWNLVQISNPHAVIDIFRNSR